MRTIEDLQAELAEKIEKLDQERKEAAERHVKEREERLIIEEYERAKRIGEIKAAEELHRKRKAADEEERRKRYQEEEAERIAMEQRQNVLDDILAKQKEKLEWLERAISDAEFTEEQYRKTYENSVARPEIAIPSDEIDVEHPVAPVNYVKPGEAVDGTSGDTPSTPLMSQHLKHILRQANRT
jgi:hypothetical protein